MAGKGGEMGGAGSSEAETRYGALFDQSPAGIVVYDRDLRVIDCNRKLLDILGVDRERFVGLDMLTLVDSAPVEVLREALSGESKDFVGPYRTTLTGRDIVMSLRATPLRDRSGEIIGGLAVVDDVTEQSQQQARMRSQFKAIPVPTYAFQRRQGAAGPEFVLVDFNDAADAMGRGRMSTLLGKTTEVVPPSVFGDMTRSLDEGTLVRREIQHTMNTTGEVKRFVMTYSPVPPDLVLAHAEDVTVRYRLEDELRQAQKMEAVGRLAGGVAHDFNNLLTVILSHGAMLADALGPSDPSFPDVVGIRDAADRAAELTRQLLAFSRKQVLQPQNLDVNGVLRNLEPMLRRLIGVDVRIVLELAPEVGPVRADPGQVEQVVINLVVNARDAMDHRGTVTLSTDSLPAPDGVGPPWVRLTVKDTGRGMDAATLAHAFEPFFTTKEAGHGTGLGLSMVYGIVQQSGGRISIASEVGIGTTFELSFPPAPAGAAPAASSRREAVARRGAEVILLAEDQDAVRNVCRRVLAESGHTVLAARDAAEAIALAGAYPDRIDLLVTDMIMPGRSGRELYTELCATRPGLPVLFMSGHTDDEMLRRGDLPPGNAFLQKPFTGAELAAAVSAILGEPPA